MKIISYNIHTGTDKDKNRTLRQMAKYLKILSTNGWEFC